MKGLLKFLRVLLGLAVTAGVVFLIVYFVRHSKPVIYDLRAYLEYSVSGYDGEAVLEASLNKNNLAEDILPQLKKKDRTAYEDLSSAIDSGRSGDFIDQLYQMTVSKTENLENGDKVKVSFSYDNESLADYGIEFTGDEETIEIKDLKEIQPIDLFEDFTLDFSGISPYMSTDERVFRQVGDAYVVCTVSPSDHLKSGETVTATVDLEESELPEGTKPQKDSISVTVSEADSFVMESAELSDKDIKRIKKQCETVLKKENAFSDYDVYPEEDGSASFWIDKSSVSVKKIRFTGETVLYTDDGTLDGTAVIDEETPNLLALYYECDVKNDSEIDAYGGNQYHVYGVVLVSHMIRTLDGNLTFEIEARQPYENAYHLYASKETLQKNLNKYIRTFEGKLKEERN
ncbi:MAG: hypothetical protein IJ860_04145 [Eubacterium sp.]|nr:hypothetical protein [Eubacterium sp.]